ncbi:hypothetical protein RHGRI_032400 [Rhododendron griersonianum]|uniref:Uncharacterized protein n=1 Tax=Rhododendron griersonianum TaxID=479676 RepID=A0AAV6ICC3_9ERIC|nr:hypothetical protein RHGRI_032400 [Rhododendron griersonianum]
MVFIPFPFPKWSSGEWRQNGLRAFHFRNGLQASGGENQNGISRGFGDWVRCLEGRRGSKQPLSTRSKDFEVYQGSPVDRKCSPVVGDAEGG